MCAGKTVEGLQRELNDRYTEYVREPNIVVQVRSGDTPLSDIIDSVDARQGQGGQARETTVSPDGTIQLPGVGSVPAVGLTLEDCLLYTSPSPRDRTRSRMPSSA